MKFSRRRARPGLPLPSLALTLVLALAGTACESREALAEDPPTVAPEGEKKMKPEKLELTEAEWKAKLTDEQYRVLRKAGTERAFTGAYWDNKEKGVYRCAGCGQVLYRSDEKFRSGTGWPSFWDAAEEGAVVSKTDRTLWMTRTELLCSRCGGHLGHVFDDGPKPTGLRHCINSASLKFEPATEASPEKVTEPPAE